MAFSTAGSSESVLLASERLDDSELASSPGGICFRRFQKKHISLGSLRLPRNFSEVVLVCCHQSRWCADHLCQTHLSGGEQMVIDELGTSCSIGPHQEKKKTACVCTVEARITANLDKTFSI